jgi:two-component system, OmpR family, alkaline phosphatase synthesis response regulator PhoP
MRLSSSPNNVNNHMAVQVTNQYRILLVDDEPDILEFLSYHLKKEGYHVFTSGSGLEALKLAATIIPHIVLLDVMMPDLDGMETCRQIREIPKLKNILIAFLTARNEDYSQIAGFDVGADDYITKPIKPRVLSSRIKALLRRSRTINEVAGEILEYGTLKIDKEKVMVTSGEVEIALPKKEFELLSLLSSKPGKVFTRESILEKIWGDEVIVGDRTIDVHIRKLREKLGEDYIKTVKGIGYKFEF